MDNKKNLALIDSDPWLEPSAADIEERYNRFFKRNGVASDKICTQGRTAQYN